MISVVIPTRNRIILLLGILSDLNVQTSMPLDVIVVDSSDDFIEIVSANYNFNLIHVNEIIQSAAQQRNIGVSLLNKSTSIVAFLDDDVRIKSDYLERLCSNISKYNLIGVSGVALAKNESLRQIPNGFFGLYRRIFMLDSKKSGALLKSGVNVPIHRGCEALVEVEWLIGCSCWKFESIRDNSFPNIPGYSLGEDVIFSASLRGLGKLAVDPSTVLVHLESEIGRPDTYLYWRGWINYRKMLLLSQPSSLVRTFSFWWANFGKAISSLLLLPFFPTKHISTLRGILAGTMKSFETKFK